MAATATFQKATIVAARRVARRSARPSLACKATAVKLDFDTTAFQKDLVEFAGEPEYIVKGGRDKFANLPKAFKNIKEVGAKSSFFILCLLQRVVSIHRVVRSLPVASFATAAARGTATAYC